MWAVQRDISKYCHFQIGTGIPSTSCFTSAPSAIRLYLQVHVLQTCSRNGINSRMTAGGVMNIRRTCACEVILSALRDVVGRTTNARRGDGGVIVSEASEAQVAAKKEKNSINGGERRQWHKQCDCKFTASSRTRKRCPRGRNGGQERRSGGV